MMELVLISGQYRKMISRLENLKSSVSHVEIKKVAPPYVYFDVETNQDTNTTIWAIKMEIRQEKITQGWVYEIYGIYKGKIDYLSYMSDEGKMRYNYYNK